MKDKSKADVEIKTKDIIAEPDIETFKRYIYTTNHKFLTAHPRICFAIIARIYRRVLNNYYFGGIKVDGDMIVDGNHRYIAYMLANVEFEIIKGTRSHCDEKRNFNEIHLEINDDWDRNHPDTEKFCNDDFLKDGKFRRN